MSIGDADFRIDLKETINNLIGDIDFCRKIEKNLLDGDGGQFENILLTKALEYKLIENEDWKNRTDQIVVDIQGIDFEAVKTKYVNDLKKCNITVVNVDHDHSIRETVNSSSSYPADQYTVSVKNEEQQTNSTDLARNDQSEKSSSWTSKLKHFLSHCLHHYHVMPPDYKPPIMTPKKRVQNGTIVKDGGNATSFLGAYFGKMLAKPKNRVHIRGAEAFASFITSFLGMMALTSLDYYFLTPYTKMTVVIGSFAATAVLTFAAVDSPLAQPKNLFFGHIISALVGVSMQILLGNRHQWLAAALAVSVAILLMCLTDTVRRKICECVQVHPPGGATALIAVYSDQKIRDLKFFYVLIPVASGALILFLVALLANNCFPWRKYPKYWN